MRTTRDRGSKVAYVGVNSLQSVEEKGILRGVGPGESNDGRRKEPSRYMEVGSGTIDLVAEDGRKQGLDSQGECDGGFVVRSRAMCLRDRATMSTG